MTLAPISRCLDFGPPHQYTPRQGGFRAQVLRLFESPTPRHLLEVDASQRLHIAALQREDQDFTILTESKAAREIRS